MPILVVFALLIAFVAIVFALQNAGSIFVSFLVWEFYGSLALILLVTLALGVLVGLLVIAPSLIKRGWVSSRRQRQLNRLEEEYQGQAQNASSQKQKQELMQAVQIQLFSGLGLSEPQTGLLDHHSLNQVLSYALDQMKTQSDSVWHRSTCLFVIEVDNTTRSGIVNAPIAWSMIADRLRCQLSPRSWLHCDGSHRFYCVTLGMPMDAATDYGEFLSTVLDDPLQLVDGSELSMSLRMGGAIARQETIVTSQQLIAEAEKILDKSSLWGRSKFRMVEAGTTV